MKTVAVFGAGIAGLTAAHEFTALGYKVFVYEANRDAGGFFRSARVPGDQNMPSEYSWHGMGPWYHNVFDLMKQIPFDETGSLYEKALSRPIDFGLAPDYGRTEFDDAWLPDFSKMFRMSRLDCIRWGWLLLKTWAANRRTFELYSRLNASEAWKPVLSELAWKTWRACFGPWIGSDWTNVSLHHAGQFFRKQLITRPSHHHAADADGPAWSHGSRDGWLLLRGPSSEYWFNKWVDFLTKKGAEFFWEQPLYKLDFDGKTITAAHLESGAIVHADIYVLATNPFAAADIVERTPKLAEEEQLRLFRPLVGDGPHIQVSLRIAFGERIEWPRERAAIIVADSEFNLTLFGQGQAWASDIDLGAGVRSLWTCTACVATVPGRLCGLPLIKCTKQQFIEEVLAQLYRCEGLDLLIKEANGGRGLQSFPILRIAVWHEWLFAPTGIKSHQPKWVTTTNTQRYLPTQATSVPNLVLAGAHTKTAVDVWSIEGAVESGRRAVQAIEPNVKVIPQYKPFWLQMISKLDDVCFAFGLPHVLDCFLIACVFVFSVLVVFAMLR